MVQVKKKGIVTERYLCFLELVNAFHNLKLSSKEKEILNELFWLGGEVNTENRKVICEKLGITSFNLNNQIGKLRKKKLIAAGNTDNPAEKLTKVLLLDIEADKKSFVMTFELSAA